MKRQNEEAKQNHWSERGWATSVANADAVDRPRRSVLALAGTRIMRHFSVVLLIVGFVWIAWDVSSGFVMSQHSMWIWQTQHLPPGETLTRIQASGAMRDLSIALKDRHRVILAPALLMLAGGVVAAFSGRRQKNEK